VNRIRTLAGWLRARAENVAALLLVVMFVAFVAQIFMRYALNWPVGWSAEVCALAWLWGILWVCSFVLKDAEQIRFDILYAGLRGRAQRISTVATSLVIAAGYAVSLPATWSYVGFMAVERSDYLDVRLDLLFALYVVFAATMVVRHMWMAWRAVRGLPEAGGAPDRSG
jgi:TRAP-type C4-dicarboxylate transport system permease small subunit